MDVVIICGPPAVGKMTVGRALAKITDLKLFHNHMSLELVNQFFDFGTPHFRSLDKKIRFDIFREIAESDLQGLVFTVVLNFDDDEDKSYLDEVISVFDRADPKVCIVELKADLTERLARNKHEDRLAEKPSKRDTASSEKRLLESESKYRMNTFKGELANKKLCVLDNTNLSPDKAAFIIKQKFSL